MRKLSIVVPAYNEAATIDALLTLVEKADLGIEKEIIVVDDGSKDVTPRILEKWKHKLTVLTHAHNRGKGAAVRSGYAQATGDYVVVQDADLELDPNDLKALVQKADMEQAGAVFGSRRLPLPGETRPKGIWHFELGGIFLSWLANILYGTHITDEPTCYKMVRRDILDEIELTANGFEFCPELVAKLARRGVMIFEVPIHYTPRSVDEGKKVRLSDGLLAVWTLVKNRF